MLKKVQTGIRKNDNTSLTVLFYTSHVRTFRSLLIGYLYEICQVYRVILLAEELDSKTEEILKDKEYFPKLEEIIPIRQFTGQKKNLLMAHRYCCELAKKLIQDYKPNIVITIGSYPFESYLRRFAREINAINISTWEPFLVKKIWHLLFSAYHNRRAPSFLPLRGKILFIKTRKYLGHFLYYWVLPLLMGQKPFLGEPSCIFDGDYSGLKGLDHLFVLLRRDYEILINDGMPAKRLYVLAHPLARGKSRRFLKEVYFPYILSVRKDEGKALTLMLPPNQIAARRGDFLLIPEEKVQKNRIEIVTLITKILKGWQIFIKPHPLTKSIEKISRIYRAISPAIKMIGPLDIAENYIGISDVIIELPPISTATFVASLQFPEKPILSLDLQQEIFGDTHKNVNGIEYINSKERFIDALELIRDDKYKNKHKAESEASDFFDINELINHLFSRKDNYEKASEI